jgi:hypothetical protein
VTPRASDAWLSRYGRVDDVEAARRVLEGPRTVGFVEVPDDSAVDHSGDARELEDA